MSYCIEIEREADGRWIAEVIGLSGVVSYGSTPAEALTHAQALALRVLADRLENGELPAAPIHLLFETQPES